MNYDIHDTLKTEYIRNNFIRTNFFLWISPRPISNIQLHALLHFHPCPIYLVVYKGSYWQARDISS